MYKQQASVPVNRIDLFCKKWLGGDDDDTRRRFILYNFEALRASPTFWLRPGRFYWVTPPLVGP